MARRFNLLFALPVAAVVALAGCSNSTPTAPAPNPNVTIVQGASLLTTTAFDPNPFTISLAAGGSVTWRMDDNGVPAHTVTSDQGAPAAFNSGHLAEGASFTHVFTVAGTYNYHCSIHSNMMGTITVTP
ncbi:MAG: cupredoxin domain-containing protein [Gemmatimonadota bacterium]